MLFLCLFLIICSFFNSVNSLLFIVFLATVVSTETSEDTTLTATTSSDPNTTQTTYNASSTTRANNYTFHEAVNTTVFAVSSTNPEHNNTLHVSTHGSPLPSNASSTPPEQFSSMQFSLSPAVNNSNLTHASSFYASYDTNAIAVQSTLSPQNGYNVTNIIIINTSTDEAGFSYNNSNFETTDKPTIFDSTENMTIDFDDDEHSKISHAVNNENSEASTVVQFPINSWIPASSFTPVIPPGLIPTSALTDTMSSSAMFHHLPSTSLHSELVTSKPTTCII